MLIVAMFFRMNCFHVKFYLNLTPIPSCGSIGVTIDVPKHLIADSPNLRQHCVKWISLPPGLLHPLYVPDPC